MPDVSAPAAELTFLDTVLRVSLTGIVVYRPLLNAAGQIVDFAFVRLNEAAQRRLHLPERPAQSYLTQYPHAAAAGVFAFYCAAYASGRVHHFDLDYPHDELNAYFQLAAQRHGDVLVVSFTDTSHQDRTAVDALLAEKRRREEVQTSERYFRRMADLVPNLIWQTDATGACVYLNASWHAYTGQTDGAGLGCGWQQAVHPDDVAATGEQARAAIGQRRAFSVLYRLRRYDGVYRWVWDTARPRHDEQGAFAGYIGSVSDIDERHQVEQALQQRTAELATARDHAQELNAELTARNEELQALNADLDTFVYMASHDLRGSVLNIDGLLQALREELPDAALPPGIAHLVELLYASAGRFKDTVDQMLQMARAQHAPAPAARTDLRRVVQDVVQDLRPQLTQAQARLDVADADGCVVVAPPATVRSVVYNLLSNALKYHHPDRLPHVQVSCQQQPEYTVLSVQDNGLGLNAAQQAELFAPFRRFHDHIAGTGIGLYVVKRIVENAGGRVQVHSTLGVGTLFRVFFRR